MMECFWISAITTLAVLIIFFILRAVLFNYEERLEARAQKVNEIQDLFKPLFAEGHPSEELWLHTWYKPQINKLLDVYEHDYEGFMRPTNFPVELLQAFTTWVQKKEGKKTR